MSRDSLFFQRGAGYNECRLETIDLILQTPTPQTPIVRLQISPRLNRPAWCGCGAALTDVFVAELILSIRQGVPTDEGGCNRPNGGRAWWAHLEFTRINTTPTILRKKIEDVREAGASNRPALFL